MYARFVSALPAVKYALEIQDLNLKERYFFNPSSQPVLASSPVFWQVARLVNPPCVRQLGGRGCGRNGGRGRGRGRSGKSSKEDGNGGTSAGAGKAKDSVTCWRCRVTGRYSDSSTTKFCDRCGSPVDMEAVFAIAEDPGDDAVEAVSFQVSSSS